LRSARHARKDFARAVTRTARGNGHVYQALNYEKNEIRILRLGPGAGEVPIKCNLIHTSLDNPLPYCAISYAWGKSLDRKSIVLNGQSVSIGRNAYDVLSELRSPSDYENFWIDAICIKQSDNHEKNHQVRNMRSIYSKACSVVVWLGRSQNASQLAFPLVRALYQLRGDDQAVIRMFKDAALTGSFTALSHLFRREFWGRIWVVQEIAAACHCTVYCGANSISWTELLEVSETLFRLQGWNYYARETSLSASPAEITMNLAVGPCRTVLHQAGIYATASPIMRLASAVCYYQRYSSCTDPRDKIYALLGITSAEDVFQPDYSSSVYDVYTKFVQKVVMETGSLNIICHKLSRVNKFSLPSWTPDWWTETTSFDRAVLPEAGNSGSADRGRRARVSFIEKAKNSTILRAKGFQFGHVQTCGNAACQISSLGQLVRHFDEWRNIVHPTGELEVGAYRRFFRTISLDHIPEYSLLMTFISVVGHLINLTSTDRAILQRWKRIVGQGGTRIRNNNIVVAGNMIVGVLRTVMAGRRFFVSSSGLLGMAPAEAQVGDKICVLLGCSYPVILRPSEAGKYYTFIGEAYVNEYMSGKAMDELDEGKYKLQDFDLL
jgi:hypothetical protein